MVILIIWLASFNAVAADAENRPKADWDVKTIVSIDPVPGRVHSGIRYRAIVSSSVESETPTYLTIDKIQGPSALGSPFELKWSKRVTIPELEKLNDIRVSEVGFMGDFSELRWKGNSLTFVIPHPRKSIRCSVRDVEEPVLRADCK